MLTAAEVIKRNNIRQTGQGKTTLLMAHGFEQADLQELLDLLDKNYLGWANYLAPIVLGPEASAQLSGELADSFCSTDPLIAKTFAKATFFSDMRHELPMITHPTLLFQSSIDSLANLAVGDYMLRTIPNSQQQVIEAKGHCLHMTHPCQVWSSIQQFLKSIL